eukprot:c36674_g1_i1 orf=565-2763(+)
MLDNSSSKATGVCAGIPCFQQASAAASIAMPSRERFYVELKPGETTFVSWKKLVKESQKTAGSLSPSPLLEAPAGAHPALEARIAPEVVKEKDPLPAPPNRFNSVIERIERLYQGGTSDEELSDFMDDDKYDTRDSFIDDTELDDYFSVENAKLKHSGFFVNRGQLEKEVEPSPPLVGPKKRKRKDLKKLSSDTNEDESRQLKAGVRLKAAARGVPSPSAGLGSPFKVDTLIEKKKTFRGPGWEMGKSIAMAVVDSELNSARANSFMASRDIAGNKTEAKGLSEAVAADRLMVDSIGSVNARDRTIGLIDINEPLERDAIVTFEPRETLSANGLKSKSIQKFAKDDDSLVCAKKLLIAGKDISPGRTKGTVLERAFLDLEKEVAELYPPSLVVREPEQGKRNRLPRDLKQKLAKVARLAAKQGRITDEMIERLMGILGHVIRERTLKRHLKAMIEMGMSAMQEKEGRLQGIKKEVTEMIKSRVHNLQAQDILPPNEIQSLGASPEKASGEGRYQWDYATEDKICDLYEQYIEGMDENKGPHLRKLYAELAELWPDGWMDNIGIKLAVHRAKERKKKLSKASNSSDVKRRRRPAVKPKMEDASGDGLTLLQLFTPGGNDHSTNEKSSSYEGHSSHGHEAQAPLQEKKKVSSKHGSAEGKSKIIDESLLLKKKMKREMDKGSIITGDTPPNPLNMSSSMQYALFGSPVASSLPFESPLQNNIGTPPNGVYLPPN